MQGGKLPLGSKTPRLSGSSLHYRILCQELGVHHSSGKSWLASQGYPKLKVCYFSFYPRWSGHLWAVPKHSLNVHWHYYCFLNSQMRTRASFKQSLNLHNFSHNLVAAYTSPVRRGILQILNKVLLSQWLLHIRGVPLQQMACAITVPCFHLSLHFQVFYAELCGWKAKLSKEMTKEEKQVYFFVMVRCYNSKCLHTHVTKEKKIWLWKNLNYINCKEN